jgi:hypothetical protein
MMSTAQRDRKLIADLAAKCRWLRESKMMGVRRASATNETGLFGDGFDMFAVTNATRGWHQQYASIDCPGSSFPASFGQTVLRFICHVQFVCGPRGKGRDLQLECLLNVLGILRRKCIFDADYSVSPTCCFIG